MRQHQLRTTAAACALCGPLVHMETGQGCRRGISDDSRVSKSQGTTKAWLPPLEGHCQHRTCSGLFSFPIFFSGGTNSVRFLSSDIKQTPKTMIYLWRSGFCSLSQPWSLDTPADVLEGVFSTQLGLSSPGHTPPALSSSGLLLACSSHPGNPGSRACVCPCMATIPSGLGHRLWATAHQCMLVTNPNKVPGHQQC